MSKEDNEDRLKNYQIVKQIASGSFSKVKYAIHIPTNTSVAIKIINLFAIKTKSMRDKIEREVQLLSIMKHPHIIRVFEHFKIVNNIYVIMEYAPRGELYDKLAKTGKFSEENCRKYFQQLLSGIEYIHHHGISHRDLKPENILLDDDGNLKIADFGLSNYMMDGTFLITSCGSPNYAAPEVVSGNFYCGSEVDIWSLGVILYALLTGVLPFDDNNMHQLFFKIKKGKYQEPSFLNKNAAKLLRRMMDIDPANRITIPEIKQYEWYKTDLPLYLSKFSFFNSFNYYQSNKEMNYRILNKIESNFPQLYILYSGSQLTSYIENQSALEKELLKSPLRVFFNLYEFQIMKEIITKEIKSPPAPKIFSQNLIEDKNINFIPLCLSLRKEKSLSIDYLNLKFDSSKSSNWIFGVISQKKLSDLSNHLFKVLLLRNFLWKMLAQGALKLRVIKELETNNPITSITLIIDIVVYGIKGKENEYFISFTRRGGERISFYTEVLKLINQLQNPQGPDNGT